MTKDIPIHCAHDRLVDITELVPNPRNPNRHPDAQIALLAKIIRHQGWRSPVVVSKRSGFIVAGHGRLEAGKLLGCQAVPVNFQEFATEADEWAHLSADNRIAELAETDGAALKDLLIDLDSLTEDFDMDLSGFTKDELERVINSYHVQGENDPNAEWQGMPEFENEPKAHRTIFVHFKTSEDVAAFASIVGQNIMEKTKFIWHPKQARRNMKNIAYGADES
jgi:hypothetical protein